MPFDSINSGGFNAEQVKIAGNRVEHIQAEILRDTIGNGWNLRQRSLITVMGAQEHERRTGGGARGQIDEMLVSTWEDDLMVEFDRTRPVVRKDIAGLINFGVLEKPYIKLGTNHEGIDQFSKRDKTLRMTETGYAEWLDYNEQMVALYVAAAEAIKGAGDMPKRWTDTIRSMVTRLLGGGAAVVVAGAITAGALAAGPAEASDILPAGFGDAAVTLPVLADTVWDHPVTYQARDAAPWTVVSPKMDGATFRSVDQKGFFDKHLPKNQMPLPGTSEEGRLIQADAAGFFGKHLPLVMARYEGVSGLDDIYGKSFY